MYWKPLSRSKLWIPNPSIYRVTKMNSICWWCNNELIMTSALRAFNFGHLMINKFQVDIHFNNLYQLLMNYNSNDHNFIYSQPTYRALAANSNRIKNMAIIIHPSLYWWVSFFLVNCISDSEEYMDLRWTLLKLPVVLPLLNELGVDICKRNRNLGDK